MSGNSFFFNNFFSEGQKVPQNQWPSFPNNPNPSLKLNPNMTGWVVIRFSSITFFLKVRKTQNQCTSLFMRKLNTPVLVLSHCDLPFLITLTLVWNLNPNMTGWVVIRFSSITFFLKVRKTQNQCTSLFMRTLNTPVLVLSHCDLPFLITLTLVWNLNLFCKGGGVRTAGHYGFGNSGHHNI